jgi:pentatricopeptide repeat protein
MDDVFARLVADRSVEVQGVHWAALINAYGCVKKDLDKAIEIFDMISSHPSTQQSRLRLPDAVTYESMINVLITVKRMDLIPEYLERLASSGVHMTAYIANLLIKGYAANGELERAREIFESLTDPPVGVAAPNNHQPHEVTPGSIVAPGAPVYREVRLLYIYMG